MEGYLCILSPVRLRWRGRGGGGVPEGLSDSRSGARPLPRPRPEARRPGSSTVTARPPQPPRGFGRMRPAGCCSRPRVSALGRGHSPPACGQKKGLPRGVCRGTRPPLEAPGRAAPSWLCTRYGARFRSLQGGPRGQGSLLSREPAPDVWLPSWPTPPCLFCTSVGLGM